MVIVRILTTWIHKFWIPLLITVGMLGFAISLTAVLLVKQQQTVKIANIPIHAARGVAAEQTGVLAKGEHLTIIDKSDGWVEVRRDDESTGWVASWLLNRQTPLKSITPLSETTIVLDAGHGGSDVGAISNTNQYEKVYTLALAKKVQKTLTAAGARVIMTRATDKIVYLSQIPLVAENNNADAFISFHFDSAPDSNVASGFTAYYYHDDNGSKTLATDMNDAVSPVMPLQNRGVEFGDFLVIRENTVPAVLLENGYINTDADFNYIKTAAYQEKIARRIPIGLNAYFNSLQKQSQ